MKIAQEIGHRAGEGTAYGNLGGAYQALSEYGKAIEYLEKLLKLHKKSVIGPEKEQPMEILVVLTTH